MIGNLLKGRNTGRICFHWFTFAAVLRSDFMQLSKLIASILICFSAAAVGSFATYPSIPTWYASLNKPFFNPPNWIFGPVWTVLYLMMAIALYLVWREKVENKTALSWFGFQLVLNSLWSIVFFGLQCPLCGLGVIILLWFAILMSIRSFLKISKPAAWLLIPYILWVTFAAGLNLAIVRLN